MEIKYLEVIDTFTNDEKNYAKEVLLFLCNLMFAPSPLSQQLVWSKFVNTKGGAGHDISANLHNEHLNRV